MNIQYQYGIIHTHTDNSIRDGAMSAHTLCQRAHELGATAVVLTDHGVLTGTYEFMKAAKEFGIKGIPGVEAYVQEDGGKRSHLLLIPKNYIGYQSISKAVTASNGRIINGFPCMNQQILNAYFGEKAAGHNQVIATSACVSGILATVLLQNQTLEFEIQKLLEKQKKYSKKESSYFQNRKTFDEISAQIGEMIQKRDALKKVASRKFGQREKSLLSLKNQNSSDYEEKAKELERDKKETEEAITTLEILKRDISSLKRKQTAIRKQLKLVEDSSAKWEELQSRITEMENSQTKYEDLVKRVETLASVYEGIFGKGNFYVELQYHRREDELQTMPTLADVARRLNLPTVACNDAHYAKRTSDDILARKILRSLRFSRWDQDSSDEAEYYIKTNEELYDALSGILGNDAALKAIQGIGDIVDQCNVEFPNELHTPKFVSDDDIDAKTRLRNLAQRGISWRYPNGGWTEDHQKRMEYELGIIEKLGYSDYLCIVEDFLRYGRKLGTNNEEGVGLGIGPGRGSAVGSLVCYLVGITGIDPMKYGLIFERFLNTERVSYPDIDSDFKTDIRDDVLDYVRSKYGPNAVCGIITKGTLAARASVKAAAKALQLRQDAMQKSAEKGHEYLRAGDIVTNLIPEKPGITLADVEPFVQENIVGREKEQEIFHAAKLIEGLTSQYGVHAAGVIIADNGNVSDYVPLAYNTKKEQWVCQCTMTEAEADAHLLKMDFLGLRNLNIITDTLRLIKRNYGLSLDMEEIGRSLKHGRTSKFDIRGNVFDDIFATGKTNSVFQFESSGMKEMLKKFRPSNIEDIILLVAAYRPGPMQYLDEIIEVKHGKKKPKYIVPALKDILDSTYGKPIYQEQVMSIFNKIAGFSLGEADIIRRAMSKKKLKELVKYHDKFIQGLEAAGAKTSDVESFWEELLDFARYAFNKSHATAYAFVAYYTAFLKLNYPTEYMTAALNYTTVEKLPELVSECAQMGIAVLPPDINRSNSNFTCVKEGEILFGLNCIKGIKSDSDAIIRCRDEDGKFVSFKDFILRSHNNKTVTENLIYCGAMDCWCNNRNAMILSLESLSKDAKKIKEKKTLVRDLESREKPTKKELTQLQNAKKSLAEYSARFHRTLLSLNTPEDRQERLQHEKELLGMYVSGHPLDDYKNVRKLRTCTISEAAEGNITLCGMLTEVRIVFRKKDGKPLAFVQLEDESGRIEVCCFTKTYEVYSPLLIENNVVEIKGKCISKGEEEGLQFVAETIHPIKKTLPRVIIPISNLVEWTERIAPYVKEYQGDDFDVVIYDTSLGEFRQLKYTVSNKILETTLNVRLVK